MSDPEQLLSTGAEAHARAVAAGEVTSVDLVEASLARLGRHDPLLNAFTQVLADEARVEAKYVVIWRHEDGRWRWHVDIWNLEGA